MKKLLHSVLVSGMMFGLGAVPVFASSDLWKLKSPQEIPLVCGGATYTHTLKTVSVGLDGSFTGTGVYSADSSYTWDISGKINGDAITFSLVYTGTNAGYTLNGTGTMGSDGTITGTLDGNCESFTMQATSIVVNEKQNNHGQFVQSQTNKKAAAQSTVGMPIQSKGHEKSLPATPKTNTRSDHGHRGHGK